MSRPHCHICPFPAKDAQPVSVCDDLSDKATQGIFSKKPGLETSKDSQGKAQECSGVTETEDTMATQCNVWSQADLFTARDITGTTRKPRVGSDST